jgi:hypothetical protein
MAAKRKPAAGIDGQLRAAIESSGLTRYAIAKQCGIRESVLAKFMAGTDIKMVTAAKVCVVLGLELRPVK